MGTRLALVLLSLFLLPLSSAGVYYTQIEAVDGKIWFDCDDSSARLINSTGHELFNSTDFDSEIEAGNYTLIIQDVDECQGVVPLTEELPNLRPGPGTFSESIDTVPCIITGFSLGCNGTYISGDLVEDSADVFVIDVNSGQTLVNSLIASSGAINVKFYFQNLTTETLESEIDLNVNTSIDSDYKVIMPIDEDGRVVVSVTSPSPDTVWAMRAELFEFENLIPLTHLDSITGVGMMNFSYQLSSFESLVVTNSVDVEMNPVNLKYRIIYSENYSTDWTNAVVGDRIKSITQSEYIEFQWNCECIWFASMSRFRHFDANWESDAPSLRPLTSTSDNSSYPLIAMDGSIESGELTLHMEDYRDILRIETTGWNESIHLVDVTVEGDIYDLELTIWDIDQNTWQELDVVTKTYSMNDIRASLEVGRGTHFIRIQHVNGSEALDPNAEPVEWTIRITTAVIDEGEEPWFPPSDEVKSAADVFYLLMGALMIIPFLIFFIKVKKDKEFAEEFASKKNRLAWLSERLDKGENIDADISRALRTMSSLEWEDSLRVWGTPELRHLTSGIDLALWRLDRRLSNDNSIPMLIGIRPTDSEWSVAAIRFEAPEGQAWKIVKVEPRLLFRKDEIFLDTISKDSRIFIKLNLEGKSNSLDVHLSGLINNEPIAAKPSKSIVISSEEE